MFNKLREAIALAEEQEFENEAINFLLLDESFDSSIEMYMEDDIDTLLKEEAEIYDNDPILLEDAELDDVLEDEEEDDVELEELLESVLEEF